MSSENLPCCCLSTELDMWSRYTPARESGRSVADGDSIDVDFVRARAGATREMRQRAGGRSVENTSIEAELRPVARANEMLLAIIEGVGTTEVRAGDRERSHRPVVASQEATERRIAGGIQLAAVRHDKRHSGGRIEASGGALFQLIDGRGQRHADLRLAAVGQVGRKEVHRNRTRDGGDRCHTP